MLKRVKIEEKGITLIALVVTIVVLLMLSGVSISMLTGESGIILQSQKAKEMTEISEERDVLDISAVQAANKDKYGHVTKDNLQEALDGNIGKSKATVNDNEDNTVTVIFNDSGRVYEVDIDGDVTYIGTTEDLLNKVIITADKDRDTNPKYVQEVKVKVKTYVVIDDMTIRYAWTKEHGKEPNESEYITSNTVELSTNKLERTTTIFSDKTDEGNYYLWVKAIINESGTNKTFGEYAIREDTTLLSCYSESNSTSPFLGNSNLQRNLIKSINIVDSLQGHVKGEGTC